MTIYLKKALTIITIAILTFGCYNSTKYELTVDKEPYFGNELRIDGYYYHQYGSNGDKEHTYVFFFYNDGLVFDGKVHNTGDLENIDKYFTDNEHVKFTDESWVWSTFKVNKDSLVFERWNPPTVSQGPEPILYYCEIINDTTFKVYKTKLYSEKEFDEVNLTYHFRKFDQKPDSTNSFIE